MAPKQAGATTAAAGPSSGARKKGSKAGTSSAGAQGTTTADQPEEEPLVAIILADSYDALYSPLTVDTPRCLLPLANVPLINYTIESAARTGVAHIYVFSSAHTQLIRDHISGARANNATIQGASLQASLHSQGIGITVMGTPEARSEGDALRELDAKQILRSDFLLYRCDSVVTTDLRPLVQEHRERRKADKDAIMTMVCMQPGAGPASLALQPVHYIDPATQQLLHYEMTHKVGESSRNKLDLPSELLRLDEKTGHDEIDVRADLIEAGVDICSIDVPPLFSENFDYQSFSADFVPGILTSDLLESKIFVHEAIIGYAGRAHDTYAYHTITGDILAKRASPLYPGTSAWLGQELHEEQRAPSGRYLASSAQMQSENSIGARTIVAANSTLEQASYVARSVLGEGVSIGQASSITDSHLHAKASIGQRVTIKSSIIGEEAKILDDVSLGPGCLIGAGCVVGPDVSLQAGTRVGSRSQASWEGDEYNDDAQGNSQAVKLLGSKAQGYVWSNHWLAHAGNENSDMEDEDEDPLLQQWRCIGFDEPSASCLDNDEEDASASSVDEDSELGEEVDGEAGDSSLAFASRGMTDLTLGGGAESKLEEEAASKRLAGFDAEAHASLSRALAEGYSAENALLELKTLRMASNVQPREVQRVAVEMFLADCVPSNGRQVQTTLRRWQRLLAAIAVEDEVEALLATQAYCASPKQSAAYGPLFVPLLKLMYNEDIVSDEAIVAWWRSKESQSGGESMLALRTKASDVVRYILEDSEDDDDDTGDSD